MVKTLTLPQELLSIVGKEYEGTYTVKMLMSKEYLNITEKIIQELRLQAQADSVIWDGVLPQTLVNRGIVYASVQKDGKALPDDIPAKLFEALASVAIPMNTLTQAEAQELYKSFR